MSAVGSQLHGAGLAVEAEVALLEIEWLQAQERVVGAIGTLDLHGPAVGKLRECRGRLRVGDGVKNRTDGVVLAQSQVERVLGGHLVLETGSGAGARQLFGRKSAGGGIIEVNH